MMKPQKLICPERRRRIPEGFSWIDHRLVRDDHFRRCENGAMALYLFLVTVGDRDGISWYSDRALSEQLNCNPLEVENFRRQLKSAGLVAYSRPYYQVLDLNPSSYDSETFNQVLRESVRRNNGTENNTDCRRDEYAGISPAYRVPDDYRPVKKLGTIISEMLKGDEKA